MDMPARSQDPTLLALASSPLLQNAARFQAAGPMPQPAAAPGPAQDSRRAILAALLERAGMGGLPAGSNRPLPGTPGAGEQGMQVLNPTPRMMRPVLNWDGSPSESPVRAFNPNFDPYPNATYPTPEAAMLNLSPTWGSMDPKDYLLRMRGLYEAAHGGTAGPIPPPVFQSPEDARRYPDATYPIPEETLGDLEKIGWGGLEPRAYLDQMQSLYDAEPARWTREPRR